MNFDMAAEMSRRRRCRPSSPTTMSPSRSRPVPPAAAASPARWWWKRSSAPPPSKAGARRELKELGDRVNRRHPLDGRGADHAAPCPPPASRPSSIGDDEMEMGVGIHGEPGRRRVKLSPADAIAEEMVRGHRRRSRRSAKGTALLFVNGFGGTPAMELYLMYNTARKQLEQARRHGRPLAGRLLCHLARHGRLLDHADDAGRPGREALGRAGAHGGAALGDVKASTMSVVRLHARADTVKAVPRPSGSAAQITRRARPSRNAVRATGATASVYPLAKSPVD